MKLERSVVVNALIALFALGSGLAIVVTRDRPSVTQREARANNLLPSFSPERLQRIEVRLGTASFALERDKAGADAGMTSFRFAGSTAAKVDPEALLGFVRSLELASFLRRLERTAADRRTLGLEAPRGELRLLLAGTESRLRVGAEARSPHGTTYVEVQEGSDEPVLGLIRTELMGELLPTADGLRPRGLVPYALAELTRIDVELPTRKLSLRRGKGPAWLGDDNLRVERAAVERFGLELAALKTERFLDGKAALATGMQASHALTLVPDQGRPPLVLRAGPACPVDPALLLLQRAARGAAAECVGRGLLALLTTLAQTPSDASPFALQLDEVESVLIEREAGTLELWRNERGFQLRKPLLTDVALEVGNRRLASLLAVRGERVAQPDLPDLGLVPPSGRVRLRSSTVAQSPAFEESVELGSIQTDGRLPVRRTEDGAVLLLAREAARAYAVDAALLRPARVLEFGPSQLAELEIQWGSERQLLRRTDAGGFALVQPAAHEHDGALVMDLVQSLGTLEVERWIADSDDGSFGLKQPRVQVRLALKGKDGSVQSVHLRVGSETSGGAHAVLEGVAGVFVIPKALVADLTTPLLARNVFQTEPSALTRIVIEHGGRSVTLAQRGDTFVAVGGADLPPPLVARLLSNLGSLRAEAAIHTGTARAEEGLDAPSVVLRLQAADAARSKTIQIGARDTWRGMSVYYARVLGVDATYALPATSVREIVEGL